MNTSPQSCQPSPSTPELARSPKASRRSWSALLIGGLLASGAAIGLPASAAPGVTVPTAQGQKCTTVQDAPTSGWTSYPELQRQLTRLESTSQGRVSVDSIGTTHRGRDILAARVGTGPKVIIVTGAIHGNERTGVEAQLSLLHRLSTGSPATEAILEEVTLVSIPMLNPDGLELNRRVNDIAWADTVDQFPQLAGAPPAWYYRGGSSSVSPGYDLNRDFHPDLDYVPQPGDLPGTQEGPGFYLNAESQALRDLYVDLQGEFGRVDAVVDLHHMGPCNVQTGGERDGRQVTVSVDYPPLGVNDGAAYLEEYPLLDQDKSRRYALAVMDGITDSYGAQSPLAGVVRYFHPDEREYAGQGRSAFALNGSASVLFEVRGQTQSFGQKQMGMLNKTVETGLLSLLKAMADGSVEDKDGDDFFDYPDYGWDTRDGD